MITNENNNNSNLNNNKDHIIFNPSTELKDYPNQVFKEVSKEEFFYNVDIFTQDLHIKVLNNKYVWEFKHPVTDKLIGLVIQYNKELTKHYFVNQ